MGTVKSVIYCNKKSYVGYNVLVVQALEQLQREEIPIEFEREERTILDFEFDDSVFKESYELMGARPATLGGAEVLVLFAESQTVIGFWVYPLQWQFPVIRGVYKLGECNDIKTQTSLDN